MERDGRIIRVGGVGTGRIFRWAHTRVYPQLLDKAWLTGFYDADASRARAARDEYADMLKEFALEQPEAADSVEANIAELRAYDSLDDLLGQVGVVDICTTTRGRMETALAALDRGVHSMGEKPMARTWIMADRAARAFGGQSNIYFQLNDDNAFHPKYLALRDLVAQGAIGNVQSLWIIRGSKLSSTSVLKSQADVLSNGGGCLMDYGSHGMAGVWTILGPEYRFEKVEAVDVAVLHRQRVLEGEPHVMEVDDNARFKVLMKNSRTGGWLSVYMEATWCGGHIGPKEMRTEAGGGGFLRIEGDEGLIDASAADGITVRRWDGGETVLPQAEYPGETVSFRSEIETFIDCVRSGTRPEVDVNFGAEITAVCGAAYLSAKDNRAIALDEFKDYCRGFMERHGDSEKAEPALLEDLLGRFRYEGD